MIIPGVPAGMTNAEMPSSVRAVTVTIEVIDGAAVGDERLAPVDHPLVAVEHGACPRRPGIAPPSGSVSPNAPRARPATRSGSQWSLLLVGAEPVDRVRAEADTCRQRDAHRLVDSAQFLDRDAQRGEVAVAAAPPLGEHDAEQTEIAHRPDHVDREVAVRGPTRRRAARSAARRSRARSPAAVRGRRSAPSSSAPTLVPVTSSARCLSSRG